MSDVFGSTAPEDAAAPGGKLQEWVEDVVSGLGFVPWLLLGIGSGAVFALVSVARELARLQPQVAGPLGPFAVAVAVVYAAMAVGLTVGGIALQGRREWARRLLAELASLCWPVWLLASGRCLVIMTQLALRYHGQRWPAVAESIAEGLAMAAVGALALCVYLANVRRVLRSPAIIAACAGGAAWAEAIRARDVWAAALLSPQGAPAPSGEYSSSPSHRSVVMSRARLVVGVVVILSAAAALSAWLPEWKEGWSVTWVAWAVWSAGGVLYHALRQAISVTWDHEAMVLSRLVGAPVRVPWSALHRVELALPPEPRADGTTPPFAACLFLRRGRPFEMVMKPDTEAGRSFLTAVICQAAKTMVPSEGER